MLYAGMQAVILGLALGYALWQLWGKLAPRSRAARQQRLALALMSPGCPRPLNRLGLRLIPQADSACGSGCNSCGVCPTA